MSSKKKNRKKAKDILASRKIAKKELAKKMGLSRQEEALAHLTVENYQTMLNYCKMLHDAFSNMLKVANEDDSIEPDEELYAWTTEQVEIIDHICSADEARDSLIEEMVTNFYSETNLSGSRNGGTIN